jgi:hypothetical protein
VNLSNNSSLLLQAVHYDILAQGFNMIDRILIPLMYIFFRSSTIKNSKVKHVWAEAILG